MTNKLIDIISNRAKAAGFLTTESGKLIISHTEAWPEEDLDNQLSYFYNSYASILVVEINSNDIEEVKIKTKIAETYLDASLLLREKGGSIIDGYLVLALTNMNSSLKPFISKIENDTRLVRKHVVYKGSSEWERYQRITPLGLLKSEIESNNITYEPECFQSFELIELLEKNGSKLLANIHGKEWNLNE
ncbi:ABC-three component system middle component 1 [Vibrio splendidus]|uniref:ABC-three component system middle component 1 n=1 Tax=Vibrio splendidus TaxID=29497 RepID=UPI0015E67A36|nr:ABC-three component system middle component 1 [Vibrio splendidus]